MCHVNRSRDQENTAEDIPDEETVLDEAPSREQPAKGIIDVPVKVVNRVKSLLSA